MQSPSPEQLADIAESFGFALSDAEVAELTAVAEGAMAAYRRLDELPDEPLAVKYERGGPGHRPVGGENRFGGWAWKCSIQGVAEGPLAGRRLAIKDNIAVAGMPMLNGTPILEGLTPREDATVVTRLLDAGAQIVGKTAVPGFCFDGGGFTGYPEPQPVNPRDPSRLAGSSSNGSAVVVVNGEADMALGTDQGGSVRIPASWSGCCGLKPTHGLVPYTGAFPIEMTLDHIGPMARTVEDCALVLEAIAGYDGLDPRQVAVTTCAYTARLTAGVSGLRIAVLEDGFAIPGKSEPDVDDAVRRAAAALQDEGAILESVRIPMHRDGLAIWTAIANQGATDQMLHGDAMGSNWRGRYATDVTDFYARAWRSQASQFPNTVKLTALVGQYVADRCHRHYYAKAQNVGRVLASQYLQAPERNDVLLLPTTPLKAQPIPGEPSGAEYFDSALGMMQNTTPFNVTGQPVMSVPCAMSDGLPVGLSIVGKPFDEATVLQVAAAYERARGSWS
ncbi:MAG: amidase [Solirubrobacteraceae bacterium]